MTAWLKDVIGYGLHADRPAAGSEGRLYYETDTDTLVRDNGSTWDALILGSGGGAGAVTQLVHATLGSAVATITLASIVGTYNMLELILNGRGDGAGSHGAVYCRCNGDSAANYDWAGVDGNTAADTKMRLGDLPSAGAGANHAGQLRVWIINYAGTTFFKHIGAVTSYVATPGADAQAGAASGTWRSTSAITQLDLFLSAGNFMAGTSYTLYGYT